MTGSASRPLRSRILRVVAVLSFATLLAALFVGPSLYTEYIVNRMAAEALRAGVVVKVMGAKPQGVGITAERVSVFVPRALAGAELTDLRLSLHLLPLLRGRLTLDTTFVAYGGKVESTITTGLSGAVTGSLAIDRLTLSQHPQVAGLGISGGTLTLNAPEIAIDRGELIRTVSNLSIKGFSKDRDSVLPLSFGKNQQFLPLPAIRDLDLATSVSVESRTLTLKGIDATSSIGSFRGDLSLGSDQLQGTLALQLSEEGQRRFGLIIAGFSAGKLTAEDRNITLSLSGTPASPRYSLAPS